MFPCIAFSISAVGNAERTNEDRKGKTHPNTEVNDKKKTHN